MRMASMLMRALSSLINLMSDRIFEFEAEIIGSDNNGAYIVFPYDIKALFNKGRVKVSASFEGIEYKGSIVNMGLKREDGSICYILGVLKSIRESLGKKIGDEIRVRIEVLL